jgi:mycobactin lysine-N-oxygenase
MAELAIIGGGPKAVAIAAKAEVLAQHPPYRNISVTVFEQDQLAAAWSGSNGYTDGLQPLCTLAERDLGFPYLAGHRPSALADQMFSEFSWQAYAIRQGMHTAQYDQWVLHGRNPPTHRQFADYLSAAFRRTNAALLRHKVGRVDFDPNAGKWLVRSTDVASNAMALSSFDGVVITGSGPALPPLPILPATVASPIGRVFDGITFWSHLKHIANILEKEPEDDRSVVIIGAGGTAAAIAFWFVRQNIDVPITILGKEATLYARHPGFFEDRLFSDEDAWRLLSNRSRDEFVSRLTTGVVWDSVLKNLATEKISYLCAQVKCLEVLATPHQGLYPDVLAHFHPPVARGASWRGPVNRQAGAVFIDARGFDRWWFQSLLSPPLRAGFTNRNLILDTISRELMISQTATGPFPPGLHVPMLASIQGPAAANLMALGWLSGRILERY